MKTQRMLGMVLLLSVLLTPLFGTLSVRPASATPTSLSVNTGSVIQSNFLGIGGVYHGFSYMPESIAHGMTDPLRAIDFDRIDRAKLRIARTWYGSDWAMPTWGGAYDWNSTKMTAFYNWLQAMKDRNVDVAINMGWWFTQSMCNSLEPTVTSPNVNTPSNCTPQVPTDVDTYTKWASDSLNQLINVKGFTNVKYLVAFTEPGDWCGCGNVPAGYTQMSFYNHVVNALNTRLINDGRRSLVKIVGPNASSMNGGRAWLQNAAANLNSAIDIYSSHDYNVGSYDDWYSMVSNGVSDIASTGKPFWLDEYGNFDANYRATGDYGTYIAEVNAAAINAKAQSSLIWLYEDQYYAAPLQNTTNGDSFVNGQHMWGTQYWIPDNQSVRPAWYAFTMMTRFMGGSGTQTYDTTKSLNGIRISATKQSDGNWSVLVVNANSTAQDITVNFSGAINKTLWRHLYNPNAVPSGDAIIGASKQFDNVATTFSDTLPARGVAIYTSIDDGTRPSSNFAVGATVSATSSFENSLIGWGVDKAHDEQRNAVSGAYGWASDSNLFANHTESITLDMGSNKTISKVDLYPRNDAGSVGVGFPVDFTIQTSTDGVNYSTVVSRTGYAIPGGTAQSFGFASTTARYVKIEGTSLQSNPNDGGRYRMAIAEIEIYDNGTPLALGNPSGDLLQLSVTNDGTATANRYTYNQFSNKAYTFQAGDYVEYDVKLLNAATGAGGIDITNTDSTVFRNAGGWIDQNGVSGHPGGGDLSSIANNTWIHRKLAVPSSMIGKTASKWAVVGENDTASLGYSAQFDNISVTNGSGTVKSSIYANTADANTSAIIISAGVSSSSVTTPSLTGTPTNVALGAAATSSSAYAGYSAAKINDGSNSTALGDTSSWANDGIAALPQWVQLDFGTNKTFDRVELYTSVGYEIKNYQIQYWNGTSWIDLFSAVTGNTAVHRTHTFAAVTGSKIRVVGNSGSTIQPTFVRVNELEVY